MKTTRLLNIFILSSLVTMAACTEEKTGNESVVTTLRANIEHKAETKTHLSGQDNNIYKTLWSEDDAIGVFAGGANVSEFKLTGGAGTISGEFTGTIPSGNKIAVYPYSICESIKGSSVSVVFPEEQTYKEGNIPDGAYPMVAAGGENTLKFKNLCSVLKISMTGSLTVNYISFSANDSKIKVSGDAVINADPESPSLNISGGGISTIKLVCPAVALSDNSTDFYIVVPAQKYTGGFSLIIDTDKGKVQKTIETDVTLKRSELYRITPFELNLDENIVFEDSRFKAFMVSKYDKNKDGEISFDEAQSIKSLVVHTDTISSLAGIEYLTNLESLYCNGSFTWIKYPLEYEARGLLKSLDISKNTKLVHLSCTDNQLGSLDVTHNIAMDYICCDRNNIESIDISKNSMLTRFSASNNLLTDIDLSKNQKLTDFNVSRNQLKAIDVSNNPLLGSLECENNQLTSIDVSNNTMLGQLHLGDNKLNTIDVRKNTELTILNCINNNLSSVDVTKNSKLTSLSIQNNNISEIDFSHNPELCHLWCFGNNISEIDLKYCPDLNYLDCSDNSIRTLKVNCCPKISYLNVQQNNIEALDISALTALQTLYCISNPLKTLNIYSGQIDIIKDKKIPSSTNIIIGPELGEDEVFSATPNSFNIDGKEQDIILTISANMDYSLDSTPEWINLKSASSGKYTFTAAENFTSSARRGNIVFKNVNNALLTVTVLQGINAYTSSDYSQDGQVTKIHSATVGKGIDVVFVGDAFADKDQDLFNKYVEIGKEAFFTEEPFKSTKDRFNIYRIGSVSKNGIITQEGGDTKFSAEFGQGTYIGGDNNLVNSFVRASLPSVDLTKTIIFVIINKAKYAGTCHMYSNNQAICYVPLCSNETEYAQTLRHEGCGHGFGKLADEYFYTSNGRIPEEEISQLRQWQSFAYGFYENVDLTNDPNTVLWAKFISDSRYSGNVGVFEGGYTYPYGVYRPTENSIMRYNTGGFNAPSREAIYKKIMNFSEGEAWSFDYETFVEFDAPARSAAAATMATTQSATVDKTGFIPLAPPVMIIVEK